VANVVLFLCSDLASNVSGAQIVVDGGRTAVGGSLATKDGKLTLRQPSKTPQNKKNAIMGFRGSCGPNCRQCLLSRSYRR
jgi:hypothetical protein